MIREIGDRGIRNAVVLSAGPSGSGDFTELRLEMLPLVVVVELVPLTYSSSPPQHSKVWVPIGVPSLKAQTMLSSGTPSLLSARLLFAMVWKVYSVLVSNAAVALGAFGKTVITMNTRGALLIMSVPIHL